jgi:hypothetical protein
MTPSEVDAVLQAQGMAIAVLLRANPVAHAELGMCIPGLESGALFQPLSEQQHALMMNTLRAMLSLVDEPATEQR